MYRNELAKYVTHIAELAIYRFLNDCYAMAVTKNTNRQEQLGKTSGIEHVTF